MFVISKMTDSCSQSDCYSFAKFCGFPSPRHGPFLGSGSGSGSGSGCGWRRRPPDTVGSCEYIE